MRCYGVLESGTYRWSIYVYNTCTEVHCSIYDTALSLTLIAEMYLSNVVYELIDHPPSMYLYYLSSFEKNIFWINFYGDSSHPVILIMYHFLTSCCSIQEVFSSCLMGDEISSSWFVMKQLIVRNFRLFSKVSLLVKTQGTSDTSSPFGTLCWDYMQ